MLQGNKIKIRLFAYLLTVDVKIDELAEAGQSSAKLFSLHCFGDVSNISHSAFLLDGARN